MDGYKTKTKRRRTAKKLSKMTTEPHNDNKETKTYHRETKMNYKETRKIPTS